MAARLGKPCFAARALRSVFLRASAKDSFRSFHVYVEIRPLPIVRFVDYPSPPLPTEKEFRTRKNRRAATEIAKRIASIIRGKQRLVERSLLNFPRSRHETARHSIQSVITAKSYRSDVRLSFFCGVFWCAAKRETIYTNSGCLCTRTIYVRGESSLSDERRNFFFQR